MTLAPSSAPARTEPQSVETSPLHVSRSSAPGTLGYTSVMATVEQQETTLVTLTERAAAKVSAIMAEEPAGEAEGGV